MSDVDRAIAGLEGLPRRNGELVFEAPWEGRVFGLVVALTKTPGFEWEDFRRLLIAEIARDPDADYYAKWLSAFERFVLERRVLTNEELESRKSEYASMARDAVI
ncbi:MAG TPA: nitrile hydratase accessory protein [Candidatus Limnocylindria bacterium]|jgi:nitrile hydratase accessory protein|nr:nitrile hydratase accessory protein [Candidatus Limnocylindria bacterium]